MKKTSTSKMALSRKYTLALVFALLVSGLFVLNYKDKTTQIAASVAQTAAPTVAPQQEQATTAPEMAATTPVKRVKSALAKPEEKLAHKQGQALYAEAEAERENDEEAEEERERQQKRESYEEFLKREFEMTKDPATGKVPHMAAFEALEAAKKAKAFVLPQNAVGASAYAREALPTVTVTPRGPFNFAGRVRQLGIDRRDNNILIAGGVSGTIMRSTNGGSSWVSVHPTNINHTINAVVQHPHRDSGNIWYAGTGEPNSSARGNGAPYYGNGILKSTDNGASWTVITPTQGVLESYDNDFEAVSKIVIDSVSGRIYAAILDAIFVSENAGASWNKMLGAANSSGGYTDIIKTGNGNYYASVRGNGIWKSNIPNPTVEAHWTKIAGTGATNTLAAGFSRIVLASSPADPNLVYALYDATEFTCANGAKSKARLERYDATANTWTDLTSNVGNCANIAGTKTIEPQSGYNLAIAVKPDDATLVYLGGTEIYRYNTTTNDYVFIGGDQGSPSGTNLHVDVHSLYFSDNTTLWSTNDGGIHKTDVTGAIAAAPQGFTWDRKTTGFNGYQFYRADISPTTGATFVGGGAQDNANMIIPNGTTDGIELGGGDGAQHAILSGTSNADFNVLTSTQNGNLSRRNQAGFQGTITPTGQTGLFVTGFLSDKDNKDYLYFPSFNTYDATAQNGTGRKLFRSRIASTLDNGSITGDPTTGYEELTGVRATDGTIISALACSYNAAYNGAPYTASNANRKLYFAANNVLFRLNDPAFCPAATAPVALTTPGASGAFISDIAVNPFNDNEVLLTYSNYNTVSIYHTTNANTATPTWTAVEGDAASAVGKASVRSALIVRSGTQTLYFVGTSTGLYATDALSGGTTMWEKVGGTVDKINFAPCVSMRLRTSDNNFVVGTHGSGLFQLSVPVAILPIELLSFNGKAVDNANQLTWQTASETDNKGFDVERSSDTRTFEKIGFVVGNGTTTKTQSYSFDDNNPNRGVSYYRLKQWDENGRFEYSKTIAVTQKGSTKLNAYPNPVTDVLTIETSLTGEYQIINLLGQVVLRGQTTPLGSVGLDVSSLTKGTYVLKVGNEQLKFIKQ